MRLMSKNLNSKIEISKNDQQTCKGDEHEEKYLNT